MNNNLALDEIEELFKGVLRKHLPSEVFKEVDNYTIMGNTRISIEIYTSERTIHQVRGQNPDKISMAYDLEEENLYFQIFGGCGGQYIYRNIDPNIEKEKYNALGREKVPFRKHKKGLDNALKALEKVCKGYIKTLKDIKQRGLLRNELGVDYSFLNR